jgi:hypothetical protein
VGWDLYKYGNQVTPNYFFLTCESTSSYQAQAEDELSFEAGDTVYIILQNGNGWCTGMLNGRYGRVQESYLRDLGISGNETIDPNRVPEIYESRLVGSEDYSNPETGGLSFQSGDTVWLLLRNQNGWCTGMANGVIGTFAETAVYEYGEGTTTEVTTSAAPGTTTTTITTQWTLVSENTECSGTETEKQLQPSAEIQDCADECDGVSSMFLFSPGQNRCFCETAATAEGTCNVIDISGWHLYKYGNELITTTETETITGNGKTGHAMIRRHHKILQINIVLFINSYVFLYILVSRIYL